MLTLLSHFNLKKWRAEGEAEKLEGSTSDVDVQATL